MWADSTDYIETCYKEAEVFYCNHLSKQLIKPALQIQIKSHQKQSKNTLKLQPLNSNQLNSHSELLGQFRQSDLRCNMQYSMKPCQHHNKFNGSETERL